MPFKYLTPFAFLALVPLGGWLGGVWTFMAAAATPLGLVGLDALLGEEERHCSEGGKARWLPRIYVVVQLAATLWATMWVERPGTSLVEAVGLALSIGVTTGVFGFVAAHELIHCRDAGDRTLGLVLLGCVFYMHFRIAHVYGHHSRAATTQDPASARLGEGLYSFLARSIVGQVREAWEFEIRRLRLPNGPPNNRMISYVALEGAWLLSLLLIGSGAAVFIVAVAIVAVALLEAFNYIAHYGLSRTIQADGRPERLNSRHSWNSVQRMNNASLFNMGLHSDHHAHPRRNYERLERLSGQATLPFGYAAALLVALIPPIWRQIMDQRAIAAMRTASETPSLTFTRETISSMPPWP